MSVNAKTCPDCGVSPGQLHAMMCDVERCPLCGWQLISCGCEGQAHLPPLPWTGEWPGKMECREFGWYAKRSPGHGWVRCSKADAGSTEDLNRLYRDAIWSKEQGRFILPEASSQQQEDAQ